MLAPARKPRTKRTFPEQDPLWYQDAIIYELHVRSFRDSNGDGMGDFRGLTERLDYLHDLGVTALWLLPFYPSPWRDDGYDISDYLSVHPAYGTLRDFQVFLREAHARGLRVITELVVNHTSDQHPWFQRARRAAPGTRERDFYVWSDTPERYADARIIFKDFESSNWSWDPVAKAYYWHRFFSHQPDLNFENPAVRKALMRVTDFWLDMGVDGMRLDAVPYLHEREGTDCENLPETHGFLKELRAHVDRHYKDRMLLAEANQWPEEAVHYLGDGDECHMAFHFPVMPRLFMALRMEDRSPIVDVIEQTPPIPPNCQWALFLRNHDELTLEMVTDSERDYMYRVYAQDGEARINLGIRRRLAPLLGNSRRRIELMNSLLFSLPGTPVLYYGDEIGMGDNVYLGDRNGVRTPIHWSSDRNAGFSLANPQRLFLPVVTDPEYHYEAVNIETQQNNPSSMLWWTKRMLAMRRRYRVFGRGTLEFLHPENRKIIAFVRRYEDESLLIVANLSRFAQSVELDLAQFRGYQPAELFGGASFLPIREYPYVLTLGPHDFYWFNLEPPKGAAPGAGAAEPLVSVSIRTDWTEVLEGKGRLALQKALAAHLRRARWFSGKARVVRDCEIVEIIPMPGHDRRSVVLLISVGYAEGEPDTFSVPIAFAEGDRAVALRESPDSVIARLTFGDAGHEGVLYDALLDEQFSTALIDAVTRRRQLRGDGGTLAFSRTPHLRHVEAAAEPPVVGRALRAEQSNTTVVYQDAAGHKLMLLKWFRRLEPGVNPDLEIGRALTERGFITVAPPVLGAIEYRPPRGEGMTAGILHAFVNNEGDAWGFTLDAIGQYFERVAAGSGEAQDLPALQQRGILSAAAGLPESIHSLIGPYLGLAKLLGRRTAEVHAALATVSDHPDFAPEPFSDFYRRSLQRDMTAQLVGAVRLLRRNLGRLPESTRPEAERLLHNEKALADRLKVFIERRITAKRIRIHGDLHLGQVLYTGKDFVIIDFEGEPTRAVSERRIKRSALRDIAGMLRSFHYASEAALRGDTPGGAPREIDRALLERAAELWFIVVSAVFVEAYLASITVEGLLPKTQAELGAMLDAYLIDKAAYELSYELNHRPDWTSIPVRGLLKLSESIM